MGIGSLGYSLVKYRSVRSRAWILLSPGTLPHARILVMERLKSIRYDHDGAVLDEAMY